MATRLRGLLSGLVLCACRAGTAFATGDVDTLPVEQLVQVKVQTASLHEQSIESAPAAISVITAEEIHRYGYRTFGEILSHVRGFYETYDHTYHSVGIDGFSLPGDWGTHILILLNGHPLNDNTFGFASAFGQDFIVDVPLIERIEIVRGPSSALYGSYGILATINVITKKSDPDHRPAIRADTATPGDRMLAATQSFQFNKTNSLLLSATLFNNTGWHDLRFVHSDIAGEHVADAVNMDGEKGYRFFATLNLGNWQIVTMGVSREKILPVSWADTILNDRGTRATDQRAFVEATWTRSFDSRHVLRWRTSYDESRYHGDYRYPLDGDSIDGSAGIDTNREFDAGDWISSQLTWRFPAFKGDLTAGSELKFDLRASLTDADVLPVFTQIADTNHLDTYAAGFVQQEWTIHRRWSFNFGARYDWSKYRSSALSPRAAIVFQPDRKTSIKLLYGRGFRNPNANELFYNDGKLQEGNLALKPELADNIELAGERRFGPSWLFGVSAYQMLDRGIIVPTWDPANGAMIFVNGSRFHGWGIGADLSGKPFPFLEIDANFQKQQATLDGASPAGSPRNLGKIRGAVPVRSRRLWLSSGLLYQSARTTLAGAVLPPVWLAEASLVGKSFQAGIRNLANAHYSEPVGLTPDVDTLPQPGRTFFLTVTFR